MQPRVSNICFVFYYKGKLDLKEIFLNEKELFIRYDAAKFAALRVRLNCGTALIFSKGYINVVGLKQNKDIKQCVKEIKGLFSRNGYNAKISKPIVNNICGYLNLAPINLTQLYNAYPLKTVYETELFPALVLTHNGKKFTIHHNGKIFSTGFKSFKEMKNLFSDVVAIVKPYK